MIKILEKGLCITDFKVLFKKKKSYIQFNLVFDRNIKLLTFIHLTDKIGNEIDKENYVYEIFVDFQKALDT